MLPGHSLQEPNSWLQGGARGPPGWHAEALLCSVLPGHSFKGPTVGCRAELETRLARMQSKLLRGEEMGGLAAAAEKKQQLLAARQREWQAQKDKAGTAFRYLPGPPYQGESSSAQALCFELWTLVLRHTLVSPGRL